MLIDRATVEVRAGKGGDGAISFLHDKNTEFGGPDGGNGGRGGSIYFVAAEDVNSLFAFKHSRVFIAPDGGKGRKALMHGKDGEDVIVKVPVGTSVYREEDMRLLADLDEPGAKALIAEGGRGGRGNASFKSSRRRIPRIAQNGREGERMRLRLELKLAADIALVGFPNAGKTSFLNLVTNARAMTGDYPFTTISPNLGTFVGEDYKRYVIADMPGLIEGASEGRGLGISFLRHIERCRLIVHLVAMDGERDPLEAYESIRKELVGYGARLEERPEVVVASKMDMEGAKERLSSFEKALGKKVFPLSSFERTGFEEILQEAVRLLKDAPRFPLKGEESEARMVFSLEKEEPLFEIARESRGIFRISGKGPEEKAKEWNLTTDQGLASLFRYLEKIGVEKKLREMGIQDGDEVRLLSFRFDYVS